MHRLEKDVEAREEGRHDKTAEQLKVPEEPSPEERASRELTHVVVLFLGFLLAQIAGWVQVARLDHRLGAERDGQDD